MKKAAFFVLLSFWSVLQVWSQSALTPSSPVLGTSSTALDPMSPVLGSPVFTNVPGPITNFTVAEVVGALSNLQVAVEHAFPGVAAFNESFEFVPVPGNVFGFQASQNFARNLGVNFGANLGVNFGTNMGQNFATSPNGSPVSPVFSGQGFPLAMAAATNGITGDTVRAMLFLQDDLARIHDLLTWLNGTNSTVTGTNQQDVIEESF